MNAEETLTLLPITMRTARLKIGWSQQELADKSKVGVKTISSFETGVRIHCIKLWQIMNIAEALGTTVAEVLAESVADVVTPPVVKASKRGITIFRSSDSFQSQLGMRSMIGS